MDIRSINLLSLCAGVGGLDLGLRLALPTARTICYVECEGYCCEVLASRMEDQALDDAPVWTDIRTFDGRPWRGIVDCVIGGYPCQPFSCAGRRRGADDPRHLWPHIARVVGEVQPELCFFENVAGHLNLGFDTVRADLEGLGYEVAAGLFTAAEVGAPCRDRRLFILAAANGISGQSLQSCPWSPSAPGARSATQPGRPSRALWPPGPGEIADLPRMVDGLAAWLDRLRAVGNAVDPVQAAWAFVNLAGALWGNVKERP